MQERDRRRLIALLDHTALNGPPRNVEKFKKVEGTDGLFEFKSFQDRIPAFYDGNEPDGRGRLVMTHGFRKKGDRMPPGELKRAEQLRSRFHSAKGGAE